jgi:hypothetical protein
LLLEFRDIITGLIVDSNQTKDDVLKGQLVEGKVLFQIKFFILVNTTDYWFLILFI